MSVRNIEDLFRVGSLLILGSADSESQRQLLRNIESSVAPARRRHVEARPEAWNFTAVETVLLLQSSWMDGACVDALGRGGCRALLWFADQAPTPEILLAAGPHLMRILGPDSVGLIHTGRRLNLSSLPLMPETGTVALIAQSSSIAAAALDWAVGRGIGFSWLVVTGGEADVDIADLLDYAALDPHSSAVVLQLGDIRQGRKFMSAARAAARIKPVLVLQTPGQSHAPAGHPPVLAGARSDPARSAAFQRAGLVECLTLGGLFEGLAAMQLLSKVPGDRIAVIGNGQGICKLAVEAVQRQGLQPVVLGEITRQVISQQVPCARLVEGGVDTADALPEAVIRVARAVLSDPGVSAVLLIRSPIAGQPHEAMVDALVDAVIGDRLLTVCLGLRTAQEARQRLAVAGQATFASADEAMQALRVRMQHRRTREMLHQTPSADGAVNINRGAIARSLRNLLDRSVSQLGVDDRSRLLCEYGLSRDSGAAVVGACTVAAVRHAELGMLLSVDCAPTSPGPSPVYGLPPLDDLLARRLLEDAGWLVQGSEPVESHARTTALVRIGQVLIDQALICDLQISLSWNAADQMLAISESRIGLAEPLKPESHRLALAAYPAELAHRSTSRDGRIYGVRAVRPTDEPAVLRLLARLDPEEIRLRFFSTIRHFSHDMAARITQVDYDREITLMASAVTEASEIAAIATLVANPDGAAAEYAVLVHHDHARRGLGRQLLENLLQIASDRDIGTVFGEVLSHNEAMLGLVRSLGFSVRPTPGDPGCLHVEIPIARYIEGLKTKAKSLASPLTDHAVTAGSH